MKLSVCQLATSGRNVLYWEVIDFFAGARNYLGALVFPSFFGPWFSFLSSALVFLSFFGPWSFFPSLDCFLAFIGHFSAYTI